MQIRRKILIRLQYEEYSSRLPQQLSIGATIKNPNHFQFFFFGRTIQVLNETDIKAFGVENDIEERKKKYSKQKAKVMNQDDT